MINYTWEQANKNGLYFKTNGKRCIITKYNGKLKDVIIPDTIDDKPIKAIGNNAFKNTSIESITIPDSVISIGKCAFEHTLLESVRLPSSIKSIGYHAFANSPNLRFVFCNEKNLSNVKFEQDIFYNTLYGRNNQLVILNNVLLKFNQGVGANYVYEVYIPYNVDVIAKYAFKNSSIKRVFLPNKRFFTLRSEAFAYCWNLNEISFYGDNSYFYMYVGNSAFKNSKLLSDMIYKHTIKKVYGFSAMCFSGSIVTIKCAICNDFYYNNSKELFTIYLPNSNSADNFFTISYNDHVQRLLFNIKYYDDFFKNEKWLNECDKVLYSYYRIKLSRKNSIIKACMEYLSKNIRTTIRVFISIDDLETIKQLVQWEVLKDKHINYAIIKAEKHNSKRCLEYLKSLNK